MATYSKIIENRTYTSTLRLEGSANDNTLIRNVTIRDVSGDGIFLKNVDNVRIENVTIINARGDGIRLSSDGSTSNVVIVGSRISNIGEDGINAGQRHLDGVDHPGLQILNNTIKNTGTNGGNDGLRHGMYIQSSDFLIQGNTVTDSNDGNGISVRSSGTIRDNFVDASGKSGIAYYADHMRGPSNRLTIEDNTVIDSGSIEHRNDIDLLSVPSGKSSYAVQTVIVRDNVLTDRDGSSVGIGSGYKTVTNTNNVVVSEAQARSGARRPRRASPGHRSRSVPSPTTGTAGNDALVGTSGSDTLRGVGGNDRLTGNAGGDVLIGGTGADTFDFDVASHSVGSSRDVLRGGDGGSSFDGAGGAAGDRIDVSGIDANVVASGNQAFVVGGTGIARISMVEMGNTATLVRANTDNDSTFEFELVIEDGSTRASSYTAADFIL